MNGKPQFLFGLNKKRKQQDNDRYSIHKHQTGRKRVWLRLSLFSPSFSSPDLSFRTGVGEPAWAEYKSNCVVSLLDNHFSAAIYMDIFFNVNVIRKYKQGSNLTQNHPRKTRIKKQVQLKKPEKPVAMVKKSDGGLVTIGV